jgi:hypothetical protein
MRIFLEEKNKTKTMRFLVIAVNHKWLNIFSSDEFEGTLIFLTSFYCPV